MSVLIFYGELRKMDYIDGTWPLYVDTVCKNCGKIHPLSRCGFCNRCGETTEYGFVEIEKLPLAFRNQETADLFEEQFNALLVATELFGYEKRVAYNLAYGQKPKITYYLGNKNEEKKIKLEFHVPHSTVCNKACGEVNFLDGVISNKGEIISTNTKAESFVDFFNFIRANL